MLNHDTKQAAAALSRYRDLGRVTLLTGHGKPWQGDMAEAIVLAQGEAGHV